MAMVTQRPEQGPPRCVFPPGLLGKGGTVSQGFQSPGNLKICNHFKPGAAPSVVERIVQPQPQARIQTLAV